MKVLDKVIVVVFSALWVVSFVFLTLLYLPFLIIGLVVDVIVKLIKTFCEHWRKFKEDLERDFGSKE